MLSHFTQQLIVGMNIFVNQCASDDMQATHLFFLKAHL